MALKMILSAGAEFPSKSKDSGAEELSSLKKTTSHISKSDKDQQLVWAEVYAPNIPDAHGHYMSAEVIQKMAYSFMAKGALKKIDVEHNCQESGAYVVESFIAREGDPDFIPGSWVLGVHIPDQGTWNLVKSGKINGFSFMGMGQLAAKEISMEVLDLIKGETTEAEGHTHEFAVRYAEDGTFLGGVTGPGPDGHVHLIKGGTRTEEVNGHSHRFSFVEGVISLEAVA